MLTMSRADTRATDNLRIFLERQGGHIHEHSSRVALHARTVQERNVALAHDLVEDKFASVTQLSDWGLSPFELDAVAYVTRGDEPYMKYIEHIVVGVEQDDQAAVLAARVKCYDIFDHIHPHNLSKRSENGNRRYLAALTALTHALREYEARST